MRRKNNKIQQDGDKARKHDFFIDVCIKGANDMRGRLGISETSYTRAHLLAHSNPRGYYLYGVFDELEKAGSALMRCKEFISDGKGTGRTGRITRNILSAVVDEQMVWIRKLTEILAELILFSATNTNKYFRHYLLVKELREFKRMAHDSHEYFACKNLNQKKQVDDLVAEIRKLETQVTLNSCWYLANKRGGGRHSGEKAKLSTFKDRLPVALNVATNDQKIALGVTYARSYGPASRSLHPSFGRANPDVTTEAIDTGIGKIGILAAYILILCRKMTKDRRRKGFTAQLARVFRGNKYSDKLIRALVNPRIKKGDFVVVPGGLAEVIKVNRSEYGYRSFTVRYLIRPPLPNIQIDTFPALYVKKLYARKPIADRVREEIKKATPDLPISNAQICKSIRETMVKFWEELGLKERVYGRPDLMSKKIEEYLKKSSRRGSKGVKNTKATS